MDNVTERGKAREQAEKGSVVLIQEKDGCGQGW